MSFLVLIVPQAAQAQSCDKKVEKIITLKDPRYNGRRIWGITYGLEGVEQINDILVAHNDGDTFAENTYVIAGDYTASQDSPTMRPFIAHVNRKGEVLWEQRSDGKLEKTAVKLIKVKEGYAVLGNIRNSKNWRGFYIERFSKSGKLLSRIPVYGDDTHVDAKSFVETADKKGFIVAAMHTFNREKPSTEAALYRIDNDGALAWRRRYDGGLNRQFNNIQLMPNGFYAVTGSVENKKTDKTFGMLLMTDESGEKGWQQQYQRGDATNIKKVVTLSDNTMILIGGTVPAGSEKESALVMKVNQSGSMLWRRYFIGDYRNVVRDIIPVIYDRLLLLVDAYPEGSSDFLNPEKGHVRVVTLSTRGDMLGDESFTSGKGVHAGRMIDGDKREHIIVGTTQRKDPENIPPGELPPPQFDSWLIATKLKYESYQDLCAPSE